ncbi:MAG: serine protease [Bradyrhizobiaceae bacterium]|nr:serine protease [Bradyrhizobiaceae bacterium]
MRKTLSPKVRRRSRWHALILGIAAAAMLALPAQAQSTPPKPELPRLDQLLSGIVRIKTLINPEGRTVDNLGRERTGSGIVIDNSGLVVTIGYLMVEAISAELTTVEGKTVPAEVLGYDYDSGFGLLKATQPLNVRPFAIGKSSDLKEKEPVLAASFGGIDGVAPALVAVRREFAGNWEYLIQGAIFTTPPHNDWSGAALIDKQGKLVGVGSLITGDITGKGVNAPGNMYVPIDLLTPVLADLITSPTVQGKAKPWIGLSTEEVRGRLFVSRATPGAPAEKAGLKKGDIILGVGGEQAMGLSDLYRKIWKLGEAGVNVPLDILTDSGMKRTDVKSIDRNSYLRLKPTL